jgi:hypothetical protein
LFPFAGVRRPFLAFSRLSGPEITSAKFDAMLKAVTLDLAPAVVPGLSAVLPRLATRYKLAIICDTR